MRSEIKIKAFRRRRAVVAHVIVNVDYGLPVHDGWERTQPIRPKHAKALRFVIHGRVVIVKAVYAPAAVQGRPFLRNSLFDVCVPLGFEVR